MPAIGEPALDQWDVMSKEVVAGALDPGAVHGSSSTTT
jgi:hypothetical protein